MKPRYNTTDYFIYCAFCVLSLGVVWVTRIIISEAIRLALEEKNK